MNTTKPTKPTKRLIPVRSIRVHQVEGLHADCVPKVHASFFSANGHLANACANAPKDGGSLKCDFVVTYEDGNTYVGGFSAAPRESHSHIIPDLREHMRNNLLFMAGLRRPPHMTEDKYAEFLKTDTGRVANATKHLTTYSLDDTPENVVTDPLDVSEHLEKLNAVAAGIIRSLEEDAAILQRNDATHAANLQSKRAFELRKALTFVIRAQDIK